MSLCVNCMCFRNLAWYLFVESLIILSWVIVIDSYTFHILHVCYVVIAFHMTHGSILSYEYKYLVNGWICDSLFSSWDQEGFCTQNYISYLSCLFLSWKLKQEPLFAIVHNFEPPEKPKKKIKKKSMNVGVIYIYYRWKGPITISQSSPIIVSCVKVLHCPNSLHGRCKKSIDVWIWQTLLETLEG